MYTVYYSKYYIVLAIYLFDNIEVSVKVIDIEYFMWMSLTEHSLSVRLTGLHVPLYLGQTDIEFLLTLLYLRNGDYSTWYT
jgi:hypothetical protein